MFSIELKVISEKNIIASATDVADAMNKIFNYPSDVVAINISDHLVELPLCYVFSDLFEDFINMINDVISNVEGSGIYGFCQNDIFDSDWKLNWTKNGELKVEFEWRYMKGVELLTILPSSIKIRKKHFINEWKKILTEIKIELSKVRFECDEEYLEITNFVA